MDQFIENFLGFEAFGPAIDRLDVPPEVIAKFRGKLPDKLLEYWQAYGFCGYAKGLFWITKPDDWEDELETWIGDTELMQRDAYYVIARTAFGELILWGEKTGASLRVVTAWGMIFPAFDPDAFQRRGPDLSLQLFFSSRSRQGFDLQDGREQKLFERALELLGPLGHDTMYGFVPALALGGDPSLEKLKVVDAHVHLDIISQVTERQLMLDISSEARKAGLM